MSFARPSLGNFAFSPPKGATVTQASAGSGGYASGRPSLSGGNTNGVRVIGHGWLAVAGLASLAIALLVPARWADRLWPGWVWLLPETRGRRIDV